MIPPDESNRKQYHGEPTSNFNSEPELVNGLSDRRATADFSSHCEDRPKQ